jgi:alpha-beta hydrolase superfamily lysophospholipase
MKSSTFTFKNSDNMDVFVYKWEPSGKPKAVVQISHGMAEHAARYERFAKALTAEGYAVYANDQRGHGKTAGTLDKAGIYGPKDGFFASIDDLHTVTETIKKNHPKTPIFLFGHSLGAFLSQGYIARYGSELKGCILSAPPAGGALVAVGRFIARVVSLIYGRNTPSPTLDKMSFGAFNSAFKPNRTAFDWLSRDNDEVDKYVNDPWCGFICTAGFFFDMTSGIMDAHSSSRMAGIPKTLPIFFISGTNDPVAANGKSIEFLVNAYKALEIKDVQTKFYENTRHETLNEINRDEVTKDIIGWLKSHL